MSKTCTTSEIQPQPHKAKQPQTNSPNDPQLPRETPTDKRRDLHGVKKRRVHHGAHENIPHAAKAEAKTSFKTNRNYRQSRSRSRSRSRTRYKSSHGNFFQDHWGKPSRYRSTGGEHHCSGMGCSQPPESQHKEAANTEIQHHRTTQIGQPEPRQQAV